MFFEDLRRHIFRNSYMKAEVKKRLYIIAASVIVIVALGSCGARKNTASNRFYHSLNSRYNIYFNGKTSFDEALKAMNDGYKENYTEQIHLFPVSGIYREEKSTTGGPFDRAIEKGNKAIKLHSIKEKPPRKAGWQSDPKQVKLQAQEEFNPFMKYSTPKADRTAKISADRSGFIPV